jgi:hypothetical protein
MQRAIAPRILQTYSIPILDKNKRFRQNWSAEVESYLVGTKDTSKAITVKQCHRGLVAFRRGASLSRKRAVAERASAC